jgi:anthranilate synthase / indole-3-glycerol phosphate synthase / phosphoribosylanthranilate isomerase
VEVFEQMGVDAVLVGESLMRAADPAQKMLQLQGLCDNTPLVKICGVKDVTMAKHVAASGAHLIGLVFAEGSKRKVSIDQAKEIVKALKGDSPKSLHLDLTTTAHTRTVASTAFAQHLNVLAVRLRAAVRTLGRPVIVGVFADQPEEEVQRIATEVHLDIIQLSGKEVKQKCLPCVSFSQCSCSQSALLR